MKKQFVPVLLIALVGICALLLADVKIDYSHSTDFSKYQTYSWMRVHASDQLWQERIRRDIDSALTSKGWMEVPANGDASVSAFGSTKDMPTLNTFYDNLGGGWFWGDTGESTTTQVNTPVGTLVVDIFDTPGKKLIWRSMASDTLSGNAQKNEKKLSRTVEDMFKRFPPKPKG